MVAVDADGRDGLLAELGRYVRDYRVEAVATGSEAASRIAAARQAGESVAMVLADHGVPPAGGLELLAQIRSIAPTAKRVLLLDWGLRPDLMPTVMRAVALGIVDSYLTKPTGARDEEFHGAVTEDLGDWAWSAPPLVEAVRIVTDEDSAERARALHDVLERLGVPTGVHDVSSSVGRDIAGRPGAGAGLPLVEVMGSTVLADPTGRQVAEAFGVVAEVGDRVFDLAVVGAGPGGLAAAVYGASEGLSTVVIEAEAFGGQAGSSSMIRNYLGFPRGITGRQLGRRAVLQAGRFGAEFDLARAVRDLRPGPPHQLVLSDGEVATARAVVLAFGVTYRRLSVASVEALVGSGVFYGAATAQAKALAGEQVVVVGAGNSGGQAAVHLARHDARVTVVARGDSLATSISDYLVQEIAADDRIVVRTGTEVVDGGGAGRLEWLELEHRSTGERERVAAAALFVLIGTETRSGWLPSAVQRDDHGFVCTGDDVDPASWGLERSPAPLETSVPGVFAVGDVRSGSVKRVAAAVGEGATSVPMVHRYLAEG